MLCFCNVTAALDPGVAPGRGHRVRAPVLAPALARDRVPRHALCRVQDHDHHQRTPRNPINNIFLLPSHISIKNGFMAVLFLCTIHVDYPHHNLFCLFVI